MIALLVALTLLQAPDEGTFVVRQDTLEVARETFRLASGRLSSGGSGWTLATTVRYDRTRPVVVLSPLLEVALDSLPLTLQYDVADPREPVRILGQLGRGRFTVRVLARASERAREFPATGRTVVLDDSVFALYQIAAWLAGPEPVSVTAIVPRGARRELLTIQDLGIAETTLNRARATLRHVTVTGGANQQVDLWLAPDGRLFKVAVPARHVAAERATSP
ncbi:MAG: hypothetical protein HYS40_07840 [Gemmatimonadetes bacterium]|nr:hypothetical protein [Gemmatimonadota bacterium]